MSSLHTRGVCNIFYLTMEDYPELNIGGGTEQQREKYLVGFVGKELELSDTSGSSYNRLKTMADKAQYSLWSVDRGLIAEEIKKEGSIEYQIEKLGSRSREVIWALGEAGEEGVEVLHSLVMDFWKGLEQYANGEKRGFIDEGESAAANLAMVRLVELSQNHKYADEKVIEAVGVMGRVFERSLGLFKNISYLPTQFGLRAFWAEAFKSSLSSEEAWNISERLFREDLRITTPNQEEYDRRINLINLLFDGINRVGVSTKERQDLLVDFAYSSRNCWGSSLNKLHSEVFLSFVDRCLENRDGRIPYWAGPDVGDLFSQEGVGRRFYNLIIKYPDRFADYFPLLLRSSVWIPQKEAEQLRQRVIEWRAANNIVLKEDQVFSCLSGWKYFGPDGEKLLGWQETYTGDIACCIIGGLYHYRETAPEQLENLAEIYERYMRLSLGSARPAGVWFPVLGEKLLEYAIDGQGAISFAGNLISEVQGVARRLRLSEPLQSVLAHIHQHLHISEVEPAADLVQGLYATLNGEVDQFEGVTKKDIETLAADSEAKSKLDLIKGQICSEFTQEKHKKHIKTSIDLSRAMDTREHTDKDPPLKNLLTEVEEILGEGLNVKTIFVLSEKISAYHGEKRGELLPVVLTLREYLLDKGINLPEGVTKDEMLRCGLNLASFTGEVSPEALIAWKKLSRHSEERAARALRDSLREDYKHLSFVQKTLKDYYHGNEELASDAYRHLTSRSLIDWLYRLVQQEGTRRNISEVSSLL